MMAGVLLMLLAVGLGSAEDLCTKALSADKMNLCTELRKGITCENYVTIAEFTCSDENQICSSGVSSSQCVKPCAARSDGFYSFYGYPSEVMYECSDNLLHDFHYCVEGYEFYKDAQECRLRADVPSCSKAGKFAVSPSCTEYTTCLNTDYGFVQRIRSCQEGKMFDESTGQCSDPCGWNNPVFICSQEGRFSDPLNCRKFITCRKNSDNTFSKKTSTCFKDHVFDQESGSCKDPSTTPCKQAARNLQCTIPSSCYNA